MAKYGLLILATPKAGREEEYCYWHQYLHVPEIMKTPGVLTCTRYRLADVQRDPDAPQWRLMTLYEIQSDDLRGTLQDIRSRSDNGPPTDAGNRSKTVILTWEEVSRHVHADQLAVPQTN